MKSIKTWSRSQTIGLGIVALGAIATLGAATLAGAPAISSSGTHSRTYRQRVFQSFDRIRHDLNLSAAQRTQVRTVLQEALPRARAIHEDKNLTPEQKRAQGAALRAATLARVQRILTPEQQRKIAILWQGRRDHAQSMLKRLAQDLQLSAEQQAQLKPIMEGAVRQAQTIVQDMSLNFAQKRTRLSRLHVTTRARTNTVLTPAQQTKLAGITGEVRGALWEKVQELVLEDVRQQL